MSGKNQFPFTLNWQSTNPLTGFFPNPNQYGGGSAPSGVTSGAMASTNTIYSNIIDLSRMDNCGLEVAYNIDGTHTAVGTLSVYCSNSGLYAFTLTLNPSITQPAGAKLITGINLNQVPYKYFYLAYTNSSGTGTMLVTGQNKDLN